jgi:CMP-N-acetylneuraminic acid synthetase
MEKSQIAVWSAARTGSQRCKRKMVRPFAETSLTDICLKKLSKLNVDTFFAGYEPLFKEKCDFHGVSFVQRTEKSSLTEKSALEIWDFIEHQPYEYFLQINACQPFLTEETISKFIEACIEDEKPKFAVIRNKNYFTDTDGNPYNFSKDLKLMNTKMVKPVYEFAHSLYFFNKSYFLENGRFWDWNEVRYIEIKDGLESFDIDTEDDFKMAEAMWRGGLNLR